MHSSAVAGRKAFSGASIPSMSRTLPARHQARTVTPQALFTKNKTKNEVTFARRVADGDRGKTSLFWQPKKMNYITANIAVLSSAGG